MRKDEARTEKELILLKLRNDRRATERNLETVLIRRWGVNYEIYERLKSVGLIPSYWDDDPDRLAHHVMFGPELKLDASDLPKVRKAFPAVKDSGHYEVEDAAKSLVKVFLDLGFAVFEGMDWMWYMRPYYLKTLPPYARCRVEAFTETKARVVCGVSR